MNTYTKEQIIRIGGREWAKGGHHRIYLNREAWMPLIGLELNHYNSGNISSASLEGKRISNSEARRMLDGARQVYLDVPTGRLIVRADPCATKVSETVADRIREAVAREVAATEPKPADAAGIIAKLREAGRTVRQIAEMVGVSISTVYRWARGVCRPRPTNAAALAALA